MRDDRLDGVHDQYGEPLPPALAELSDEELADLATALDDARDKQSRALDEAIDRALGHLPWPLRAVVRKVLVG